VIDAFILQELDEVDVKEAFADTAFAVEGTVESLHVLGGATMRTWAIRGPRCRAGRAASVSESLVGLSGEADSVAGTGERLRRDECSEIRRTQGVCDTDVVEDERFHRAPRGKMWPQPSC
jgi:hypothetical protein